MCPRSGFRSGGTCEHTLVPVFFPGEHPNAPSFRFSFWGNIRQTHPCGNHPLGNPWNLYCKAPPICIAVPSVPLSSKSREILSVRTLFALQYATRLYRNIPPMCVAMLWKDLGGWGHRDAPHTLPDFALIAMLWFGHLQVGPWVANPPTPYSIQERPEPKICPTKYVPVIIFEGSSQGDWNSSNILSNLSENCRFFFDIFWQIPVPQAGTLKNNRRDKSGVWSVFDRVHAKGVVLCERRCFYLVSTF